MSTLGTKQIREISWLAAQVNSQAQYLFTSSPVIYLYTSPVYTALFLFFFLLCFCTTLSIHNVCVCFYLVVFKLSYKHHAGVVLLISLYVLFFCLLNDQKKKFLIPILIKEGLSSGHSVFCVNGKRHLRWKERTADAWCPVPSLNSYTTRVFAGVRVQGQKHIARRLKRSLYGSSLTSEGKKR